MSVMIEPRTLLITGATGLVGGRIAALASSGGRHVRALVRSGSDTRSLERLEVELMPGDICDPASIFRAIDGCDEVCHAAALVPGATRNADDFERINVGGTENVLAAAERSGVRKLVHVSTVNTLAAGSGETVDESAPPPGRPHPGYDMSKLSAEKLVRQACVRGLDAVIVSPAIVFGPGSRQAGRVIEMFLRGRLPVLPFPDRRMSLVFVDDVAQGCLLALDRGRIGERYILANPPITVRAWMDQLATISGRRPPRFTLPTWLTALAVGAAWKISPMTRWRPPITVQGVKGGGAVFNGGRAERELGLSYTPLADALSATVARMRDSEIAG